MHGFLSVGESSRALDSRSVLNTCRHCVLRRLSAHLAIQESKYSSSTLKLVRLLIVVLDNNVDALSGILVFCESESESEYGTTIGRVVVRCVR